MTDQIETFPVPGPDIAKATLEAIVAARHSCDPENDGWKGVANRMADAAANALASLAAAPETDLYLIAHTTDDGDSCDLVVEAADQKEAVELWRTWDFADSLYEGQLPDEYNVFKLPPKSGVAGAKQWHKDVIQVGP